MAIFTLLFWLLTAGFSTLLGGGSHGAALGHAAPHTTVRHVADDVGGMPPG